MTPTQQHYQALADTILKNLKKRRMDGCYCATAAEAKEKVLSCLTEGCSVSFGGSMTLEEAGILDAVRGRSDLRLIDRAKAGSPEEVRQMYHDALSADFYLMSTNAITTEGELVNIDGTGNRVAALIYGPEHVIVIAGMNKVAADVPDAIRRVHNVASPINCQRLNRKTPCAATGVCSDCLSPDCICSQTVITRRSGVENRISVILVGEELGY